MWLGRSPGPTQATSLVALGMLTNVPRNASKNSVLLDLQMTIAANSIEDTAQALTLTKEMDRDNEMAIDDTTVVAGAQPTLQVYLQGSKATAKIPLKDGNGFKIVSDNHATVIFSEKEKCQENCHLLEAYSKNLLHGMK